MSDPRIGSENPLKSLATIIATDSADWGADRVMAWIYGIVLGWDDDPDDPPELRCNAMDQIATQHNWSYEKVARLRRLHTKYLEMAG